MYVYFFISVSSYGVFKILVYPSMFSTESKAVDAGDARFTSRLHKCFLVGDLLLDSSSLETADLYIFASFFGEDSGLNT